MNRRPETYLVAPSGERRPLGAERVSVRLSGMTCELNLGHSLPFGMELMVFGDGLRQLAAIAHAGNLFRFELEGDIAAGEIALQGQGRDGSSIELPWHEIHLDYGPLGNLELTFGPPSAGTWDLGVYLNHPQTGEDSLPTILALMFGGCNTAIVMVQRNGGLPGTG